MTHKTSTSTDEATEQKAKGTSSSSETSWEGVVGSDWIDFGGGGDTSFTFTCRFLLLLLSKVGEDTEYVCVSIGMYGSGLK